MRRKKVRQKIVLHPVMVFIIAIIAVVLLSGILSLFNVSFTHNSIIESRMATVATSQSVSSLLNLHGVKYIFANTVSNFANFTILSNFIIILLGIGVMEYSGFLKTAVGFLTRKSKKKQTTFVLVLICLISSIFGNLPFLAFIPLSALIYKYGKRNPSLGVIASFASLTCGYGLSIFFTSVDSSLMHISTLAASIIDPNYSFKTLSLILIMSVSILIMAFVITSIVENNIAKKLPKYEFENEDVLTTDALTHAEQKGLLLALLGSIVYLLIFIYNIIPGLPFSGNFLNYSEAIYIDKLFGANSFFADGFVFVVTILFIIWGLLYGIGAKTIKNNREFVDSLGHSLNGIGKMLVYIFAGSTFISIFKQTNIGNMIVAGLTNLITGTGITGLGLIILLFIISMIATIFVPTSAAKWTIMAPSVIPAFLSSGLTAEFAQTIFRFGESATLGLTPLFSYFLIYLAYIEHYRQVDDSVSIKSAIKYQLPFSMATAGVLLAIIILWYIISLPLGISGYIAL